MSRNSGLDFEIRDYMDSSFGTAWEKGVLILRLQSVEGANRLTRRCVQQLNDYVRNCAAEKQASSLVIAGNERFFSSGADLREIRELDAASAYEFSRAGQELMAAIEEFPAPVYAAISGYCMGGGLDLALACHHRIASPRAIFGHRGAALGLMTGWGGTQRLPRLVGTSRALEIFVAAEKIPAARALAIGMIDAIVDDPVSEAVRRTALPGRES